MNRYACLVLVCATVLPGGQAASPADLNEIRTKAALMPRLLGSVEFRMRAHESQRKGKASTHEGDISAVFYERGGMFRVELKHRSEKTESAITSAYNGDRYQVLFEHEKRLSLARSSRLPNPYFTFNPLILPYAWLFRAGMTYTWSEVKNPKNWERSFEEGRYIGQSPEGGFSCEVVELPAALRETRCRVYFARELGYYPLKVIGYFGGEESSMTRVLRYRTMDVDGHRVVFPTLVVAEQRLDGEFFRAEYRLEEDSIKLNHPIDEEVFTISPSRASIVVDLDELDARLGTDAAQQGTLVERHGGRWRFWMTVGSGLILLALVALALLGGRRGWGSGHGGAS